MVGCEEGLLDGWQRYGGRMQNGNEIGDEEVALIKGFKNPRGFSEGYGG